MNGFVVVNPDVLIARRLERMGWPAPSLHFIAWRIAEIRAEVQGASLVWTRFHREIAAVRAKQLADARGSTVRRAVTVHATFVDIVDDRARHRGSCPSVEAKS